MWSRVLSGTKTGQVLRAGGKEPIQRPFLAGPADRCRVHTYLVCRTELQMVCRQLQADWTSDCEGSQILSAFRVLKRQVDDSETMRQLAATGQGRGDGGRLPKACCGILKIILGRNARKKVEV